MSFPKPPSWAPPAPTFIERVQLALLRAAVAALVISLLAVVAILVAGAVDVAVGTRDTMPELRVLIPSAGLFAVAIFVLLAPVLVLLSTRRMQDHAFTLAGLAATLFGLIMLLVFFAQLGLDVIDWFVQTPRLIERQNAKLVANVADAKEALARASVERDLELAKVDADKTKTAAAKAQARAEMNALFDKEVAERRQTLAEQEHSRTRDFRADTSAGAMFWYFMTHGSAPLNTPQDAGIWFPLLGSLWMGLITLLFAVPVGVGAAIYLEEYRSGTRLSRLIQLNINNLAGVPSVVYGILGAFVFVGLIFQPLHRAYGWIEARNVVGGGLTLGLLTLPVVIVAAQEAIRAVPSSMRHGAIALGAMRWQTTWRTVLPISLPGILTGTILSLSRAIGEAAPLLLFGAIMYVDGTPSLFRSFSILPMQIFSWAQAGDGRCGRRVRRSMAQQRGDGERRSAGGPARDERRRDLPAQSHPEAAAVLVLLASASLSRDAVAERGPALRYRVAAKQTRGLGRGLIAAQAA